MDGNPPRAADDSRSWSRDQVRHQCDDSPLRRFAQIDDVLGPAAERFFGDGHRRVRHCLRDVAVESDGSGRCRLSGVAAVTYPSDWSVKSENVELRPHLSTIDAAVFAFGLAETYLRLLWGLDAEQRRRAWVRSMEMRASGEPQEELARFAVRAEVVESAPLPFSLGGHVSTLGCQVGGIKVRCQVEHEQGQPRYAAGRPVLSGEQADCVDAYKQMRREIEDLRVAPTEGWVHGLITVTDPTEEESLRPTIGAAYRPTLSPIDGIITAAQMAQALLYCLDDVDRAQTNTLWMRRVSMVSNTPYQPVANPFVASVSTVKHRVTAMGGKRWRTADLHAQILGMTGSFSVTHTLPVAA